MERRSLLQVEPVNGQVDLPTHLGSRRADLEAALLRHGAVLFRGFRVSSAEDFRRASEAIAPGLLDYRYRSTPRTSVQGRIYTATEYPSKVSIPLHNENAYQRDWPMKLMFCCLKAAHTGGSTPIADTVAATRALAPGLVEEFERRKVLYVRNYGSGIDLPWQTVFQTSAREEVERFCRESEIEFEWRPNDCLRTRQVCQGVATHPRSGERVWFNQAHLFHVSSLDAATRKAMSTLFREDELPRNAYFGDGAPLDPATLDEVRRAFHGVSAEFPWRAGDVLVLDNMLMAHGRAPFSGDRTVLVSMAEPFSATHADPGTGPA